MRSGWERHWHDDCYQRSRRDFGALRSFDFASSCMSQVMNVNPASEHMLYLTLFVSNAGGV